MKATKTEKTSGFIVTPEFKAAVVAHNNSRMLYEAIEKKGDDVNDVKKAVEAGADLNRMIEEKLPLQWAIHHGKFERFKTLTTIKPKVGEMADLNAPVLVGESKTEMSLLHYAAYKGLANFVRYMVVQKGMDTTLQDKHRRGLLPIHHAVRSGDCDTLGVLNDNQQALRAVTALGDFCIHIAAIQGQVRMLKYLVKLGADVNSRNTAGETPLHVAVLAKKKEAVKFLLTLKTSRNDCDNRGRNCYLLAVQAAAYELIPLLVLRGDTYTATDNAGMGAMHIAAEKNNPRMMRHIKDCDVLTFVATDKRGRYPIHVAAEHDALEAFNFIIDELLTEFASNQKKGEPSKSLEQERMSELYDVLNLWQDENGDTVVDYALRFNAKKILQRLLELKVKFDRKNKSGNTPLHEMAAQGNVEMTRFLIGLNVSRDVKNDAGQTPMQIAFIRGCVEILEIFSTIANFNFKAKDAEGITFIHEACAIGQQQTLEWLLSKNFGSLTDVDTHGRNGLFHAARNDQAELVEHLVTVKKMSVKTLCSKNLTVMHHAIFKSAEKAALVLKKLGMSFEVRGDKGMLPLHLACRSGLPKMVDFLIGQGVNKDATNFFGQNAWFYAGAGCHDEEIFKTLERHQVRLEGVFDNKNMTPLHHAALGGNLIGVKYFLQKGLSCLAKDEKDETPRMKAAKSRVKYEAELNEKLRIPEYMSGKNVTCNDELNQLRTRIDGCQAVEDYLAFWEKKPTKKIESEQKSTKEEKNSEKRERGETPDTEAVVRVIKPRMASLPADVSRDAVESDTSKQLEGHDAKNDGPPRPNF